MTSKTETILQTLAAFLDANTSAKFERNASVPEKIPSEGMIILRDGNPGVPDEALGGFGAAYYEHEIEIEIYVAEGKQIDRDTVFDALVMEIGAALELGGGLNGFVFGMTYARPDVSIEIIPGSHAIKSGTIDLTIDYETPTPLS